MAYADMHIRTDGCHVAVGRTDALADGQAFEEALARVSAWRRAKAQAFRFAKDRRLSLLAGLLLDELLADYGLREQDMAFGEGDRGKPVFQNRPELHFSLAHSQDMAVAALARMPVGVDVEHLAAFPRDLAEPFLWTEMESVGKLLGCGMGDFVDGGDYRRPADVAIEHIELGDYLVCIARRQTVSGGLPWGKQSE